MKTKIIPNSLGRGVVLTSKQKLLSVSILACTALISHINGQMTANNTTRIIPAGSVILNMGVIPQTVDNGLKPYGLVYNLVVNQKIPVIWSISPTKTKDGIDFSVDGIDFKGGAFIIEKQYAQLPAVQSLLNSSAYDSEVVKHTTLNDVAIPFYKKMTGFTKWTFDTANGSIADNYLTMATIPLTARQTALPGVLNSCNDLFVLPHATAKWSTHGRLYEWVRAKSPGNPNGNSGWLWSGCLAPNDNDGLENMYNPSNTSQRTNFLTSIGTGSTQPSLVLQFPTAGSNWKYAYPNDSPMQIMGTVGTVLNNGSYGAGYKPTQSANWNAGAKAAIKDPTVNATEVIFGYAYDNANNGAVMYEAGHDFGGSSPENVAATRIFLNFIFDASSNKLPQFNEVLAHPSNIILKPGESVALNVSATAYDNTAIGYQWTQSDLNGSFSSSNNSSTSYTAETLPVGVNEKSGVITISATDPCGRKNTFSYVLTVKRPDFCYKPSNSSIGNTILDTKFGISALNKTSSSNGSWPALRKGGWIALEARSKGFVITRVAKPEISISNPVDGMMVYDTTLNCLRIYVVDTITPTNTGWKCFDKQSCPDQQ